MGSRRFLVHVCAVAFVAGRAESAEKKFSGSQFATAEKPPTSESVEHAVKTSPSLLPPLQVKVLIPAGRSIPPSLVPYLLPDEQPAPLAATRQLVLRNTTGDAIETAVAADAVRRIEVVRPPQFDPIDAIPFNIDARLSHSVGAFEASLHAGRGATVKAAVFDGGLVRKSHVEFATGRVSIGDAGGTENYHATHVAGTMAAKGIRSEAIGMAPALGILSFNWDDDLDKLRRVASQVQVTNHSYGPSTGWDRRIGVGGAGVNWIWWGDTTVSPVEDSSFGKYSSDNQVLDEILFQNPKLLTVVAAGNDRDDAPMVQPVIHLVRGTDPQTGALRWLQSSNPRNPDGFDNGGLDTIAGLGLSKNALCVGGINDLFSNGSPLPGARLEATVFSSRGPADDGRVKPDVVANGQTLLSPSIDATGTSIQPDEIYQELSGTSMAAPTVAGIASVLAEFFKVKKGQLPTSAELKAVLIHTATDGGVVGPDPIFGHGSINALRAGELINGTGGSSVQTAEVLKGQSRVFKLEATGQPTRVTIVWTDPPAVANVGGLDDPTRTLQNDLDLTLVGPDGATVFPYQLLAGSPMSPPLSGGPNRVDNVEVVDAKTVEGTWTVTVKATDLKQGDRQAFALAISGLRPLP